MNEEPARRDFYSILRLPSVITGQAISDGDVKAAFRAALLRYHPDKSRHEASPTYQSADSLSEYETSADGVVPSVDELLLARMVLTNQALRKKYDRELLYAINPSTPKPLGSSFDAPEFRVIDLDDMEYHSENQSWTSACRCGNPKAFTVMEPDLIEASEAMAASDGEIMAGCDDCSLFAKITYHVEDEALDR